MISTVPSTSLSLVNESIWVKEGFSAMLKAPPTKVNSGMESLFKLLLVATVMVLATVPSLGSSRLLKVFEINVKSPSTFVKPERRTPSMFRKSPDFKF